MSRAAFVYILASHHRRLYIGVTTQLPQRIAAHKAANNPLAFTARYQINRLVYIERFQYIHTAIAREKTLKGWLRQRKIALIVNHNPTWRDLSLEWGTTIPRPVVCYPQTSHPETTMARGVNKVILVGNVGKDPEIRATAGGMSVASFTLATADRQKDQSGQWTDKTEWHNLVAFQRTAEIVRDYVKKGSQLYIEGKIQTRSWDDKESGQKRYKTEILVNDLQLLGGRGEGASSGGGYSRSDSYSQSSSSSGGGYGNQSSGYGRNSGSGGGGYDQQRQPANNAPDFGDEGITDDDIPF